MKRPWLWWAAVAFWISAGVTYAFGAEGAAAVDIGDVKFNISQVLLLFAVGAAWGDMRRSSADMGKRLDHLEKRLDDL